MSTIKFTDTGKKVFLISFICGTLILMGFIITKSWFFVWLGFYYVIIAFLINVIVVSAELLAVIIHADDGKSHGKSVLLMLLNIPIALLYFYIFIKL